MKEHPILFSGDMVQAVLEGRKTQTRRMIRPQPPDIAEEVFTWYAPEIPPNQKADEGCYYWYEHGLVFHAKCPYGQPGDRLWVRETHLFHPRGDGYVMYRADNTMRVKAPYGGMNQVPLIGGYKLPNWRSSIHMPRWASRITLEVVDVRVERVQEISMDDLRAEDMSSTVDYGLILYEQFAELWDSLNAKRGYGWETNPWVWVVEFKVMK